FGLNAQASSGLPVSLRLISGPVSLVGTNLVVTGIGTVTVRASQSGDASFKAAPVVDRTFIINPAVITVTASNQSKLYGAALPALTVSYTGFVNGETVSVMS